MGRGWGLLAVCTAVALADGQTYRAAVVQGMFENASTTQAGLVESFVRRAAGQGAQIIVFGESALGSDTALAHRSTCEQAPEPGAHLCSSADGLPGSQVQPGAAPVSSMMGCLARKYSVVVVFCLCDVQGQAHYNTQLAAGPGGRLLAKYHKMHLYDPAPGAGESTHATYPPAADPVYFDTEFGVRFGMHTCFDIVFSTPAAAMAADPLLGISDFVYPVGWVTAAPPMLPGLGIQQGWSRGTGANLLAAESAHSWGSAGSGIYSKGRVLAKILGPYNTTETGTMIIADVPILRRAAPNVQPRRPDWEYKTYQPPHTQLAGTSDGFQNSTALVRLPQNLTNGVLNATTLEGFSCSLSYSANLAAGEQFALMALDGHWLHGVVRSRSCLLFRCSTGQCSVDPLFQSPSDLVSLTKFSRLELKGTFHPGDPVWPIVILSGGDVLDEDQVYYNGGNLVVPRLEAPLLNAMLFASL